MSVDHFLDTNILVYAVGQTDPAKKEIARKLWLETQKNGNGCISSQVVHEFINVALKKFQPSISHDFLRIMVARSLLPICRVMPSLELYQGALDAQQLTHFSWYDCLILQAAVEAGCRRLYSEDFQTGFKYRGVVVVNPFA